jgi:hypothetical protein
MMALGIPNISGNDEKPPRGGANGKRKASRWASAPGRTRAEYCPGADARRLAWFVAAYVVAWSPDHATVSDTRGDLRSGRWHGRETGHNKSVTTELSGG